MRIPVNITLATYILIGSLLLGCKTNFEKTQPKISDIIEAVYASGIIKSKNQYSVFPQVNGIILSSPVKQGDKVKKGDILFIIKNENAKLNRENANLSKDLAIWNLQGEKLNELNSNIRSAKIKLQNDSIIYFRQVRLWNNDVGTKAELETVTLAYENSKENYKTSQLRFNEYKRQLEFTKNQSLKNYTISKNNEDDFIIRSAINGTVYSIKKEVGEMATTQNPVAILGSSDNFIGELEIDENDIAKVKNGMKVLVTMDSYKNEVFEGTIVKINPFMNEASRTFTIEMDFLKAPSPLFPNLTLEANVILAKKEKTLLIPRDFLLNDNSVLLENKEIRKIKTGLRDYVNIEVIDGLKSTDILLKEKK
jgi:HlyD family secretion protein